MSVIEECIGKITGRTSDWRNRDPLMLIPSLSLREFIGDDDPLRNIFPREIIDRWNAKVQENIDSGGEIERNEAAAHAGRPAVPPIFLDCTEPMDLPQFISRKSRQS